MEFEKIEEMIKELPRDYDLSNPVKIYCMKKKWRVTVTGRFGLGASEQDEHLIICFSKIKAYLNSHYADRKKERVKNQLNFD